MTRIKSSRSGHWGSPPSFVMPTPEEIAEADERQDIKRACSWMPVLLPIVPLVVAVAVHLFFR